MIYKIIRDYLSLTKRFKDMKVYIQVVDKRTGIYQSGMIEEQVVSGQEVANALAHFGIQYGSVTWYSVVPEESNSPLYGTIDGTTKVVFVLTID